MKRKLFKFLIVPVCICTLLFQTVGCSSSNKADSNAESSTETVADEKESISVKTTNGTYPITITDCVGNETVLEEAPKNVAVLSGTPLNIWYDLGGKSICTSNVSDNVKLVSGYEDEIKSLPSVGAVYSINVESVIASKPDFIIAQKGTQSTEASKLRDMGYKVITTQIKSFADVVSAYKTFGTILEKEDLAKEKIADLKAQKKELEDKKPNDGKSVVILYVTSKSVAAKLDNSIAGDVANTLGLKNIASDLPADTIGSETTPLDIEYIADKNPDYVLVTSMISNNEKAKETMEENFKNNAAWKSVKAVSEGRIIYLPQQYFLYNAGPYYCEGIDYMARSIYPDIYGKVEDFNGK